MSQSQTNIIDTSSASLAIDSQGSQCVIMPHGSWRFATAAHCKELLRTNLTPSRLHGQKAVLDCQQLQSVDTVGAMLLLQALHELEAQGIRTSLSNVHAEQKELLELVAEALQDNPPMIIPKRQGLLWKIGEQVVDGISVFLALISFIGESAFAAIDTILHPRTLRVREIVAQFESVAVQAFPVVVLVTALIGVVIAYLFSIQIEKYGANIFIVDGVGLAMCRELSPIIVAIIVAGRSGSAFTAHIGTMKINEEIDALVTLGLSPQKVLVLPRLFALVLAMPLLVFIGDVVGILGAMIVADVRLGITWVTFVDRLQVVVPVRSFLVGLIKAPVFAAFIAVIGCRMGMIVENNARSLGMNTTSTVVQSIVSVILLNAAFAVIFVELGI